MSSGHLCFEDEAHRLCVEEIAFPRDLDGRPGLDTIDYRIGTYADIQKALFHLLDQSRELAGWTHRGVDDPGIAVLEGAAVIGDILTFYQHLYANETKLRTAKWRDTLADLVQLTGYRLAPGLGGRARVSFDVSRDVVIPAGFAVRTQLEDIEEQTIFETTASVDARSALSEFELYRPLVEPVIAKGTSQFRLVGDTAAEISEGDRLLMAHRRIDGRHMRAEILVVDDVRTLHGETLVTTTGSRQSATEETSLAAYKIDRSFRHFGHNGPPKLVTVDGNGKASSSNVGFTRSITDETTDNVEPDLDELEFPLDAEVDDLSAGARLIVHEELGAASFTVVRTAAKVHNASYTWGAMTGPATVVTLDNPLRMLSNSGGGSKDKKGSNGGSKDKKDGGSSGPDIRNFHFHEIVGTKLTAYAAPADDLSSSSGRILYFHGAANDAAALLGRQLITEDGELGAVSVTKVMASSSDLTGVSSLHEVELDCDLTYAEYPNEPDDDFEGTTFLGNVAMVDQGETQDEVVLGNGDARQRFQTFKLPKSPLTFHYEPSATPPQEPQVEIRVDGRSWRHVPTLYGQPSDAEVFVIRHDDAGDAYVQFGDGGLLGARLPSGVDNVTAVHRNGSGAFGPVKDGTTPQAVERLDGVDGVALPGVVSGGAEREGADVARVAAPGRTQSLDRIVGLSDFEAEALAVPGVVKAAARWESIDGVPTVGITALMAAGREDEYAAVAQIISSSERDRGPDRHAVIVREGRFTYVYLDATVGIVPGRKTADVLAAVRKALGESTTKSDGGKGLFGMRQRSFGEPAYATSIAGAIQMVPGVSWCRVDALASVGEDLDADVSGAIAAAGRSVAECGGLEVLRLQKRAAKDLIRLAPATGGSSG